MRTLSASGGAVVGTLQGQQRQPVRQVGRVRARQGAADLQRGDKAMDLLRGAMDWPWDLLGFAEGPWRPQTSREGIRP